MVSRFKIEDLLTQNASGVIFRALDTETNRLVAVRRFFPFGVDGGGLSPEEQADYNIAVGRLSGIAHPALRAIICGGCDPVDGMPFIATEWVEGDSLQTSVELGLLSHADAVHLLRQALEVCEQISMVLGEEDVWIETDLNAIIVGDEASGRGATFWISPMKWLGGKDGLRGLKAIASLAENIMGWRGKVISDHDGGGLGGWVNRLREADTKLTLSEAHELLAGVSGAAPAAAVKRPVRQAIHGEALKTPKRKSSLPFVIFGTIALAAISLGGWGLIQWNNARLNAASDALLSDLPTEELAVVVPTQPPAVAEKPIVAETPAPAEIPVVAETPAAVNPAAIAKPAAVAVPTGKPAKSVAAAAVPKPAPPKTSDKIVPNTTKPGAPPQPPPPPIVVTAAVQKPAPPRRVFKVEESAELLKMDGKEVTLEGVLLDFENCTRGKNLYLVFSDNQSQGRALGSVAKRGAPPDLSKAKLASLKGKKIQLSGKIRIDDVNKTATPVISIESRAAIKETK